MSFSEVETLDELEHPLANLYEKRVKQSRDLTILVTDSDNERGTGKTVLSLKLAAAMDRTEDGMTSAKTSISPEPLSNAYTSQPRQSSLVLDEAEEGMSKYRSGSAVNRALRKVVSMGRVEEKYLVLNAPAAHAVDSDLRSLVDIWIIVQQRGFAHVYSMGYNPFSDHELTEKIGNLRWTDIPRDSSLRSVYDDLTGEKQEKLTGEDGENYVTREEAREMVESAKEDARTEKRDELIAAIACVDGVTQQEIANAVGLSRSRVSQIAGETG